ncbi:hypothetical protein ACFWWB_23885 [Streptomyces sp. NPDC058690]|uniref:hypothetical protein n=1 Tax=Streptomyces sp. NPDC058690 TaxID=3346600 RepID=UPI00364ED40B
MASRGWAFAGSRQVRVGWIRGHSGIDSLLHHVRDRTFREEHSEVRTGHLPRAMAGLRNLAISVIRRNGKTILAPPSATSCISQGPITM